MPVNARRLVRKMRGGAQAHLIEADDGSFYVVKFKNNPQHLRVLINELIAGVFLRYLQITTPQTALVRLTPEFLNSNPDLHVQLGSRRIPVEAGWHFGSRYPGDPDRLAVYDFIPDLLLEKVVNLREFLGALVFDKWTGNADARQAIFFRSRVREWRPAGEPPARLGFLAQMIDHGYIFNGPHWDFPDSPLAGLYFRPVVYQNVRSWDDFQPWLDRVVHFPEEVIDEALRSIPPEWLEGSEDACQALLDRLLRRRRRVPDLIGDIRRSSGNPFLNWR